MAKKKPPSVPPVPRTPHRQTRLDVFKPWLLACIPFFCGWLPTHECIFSDFAFMWDGSARKHAPLEFSFDFEEIVEMIRGYLRIMSHWNAVLPLPIFELKYERLVTDFDEAVRNFVEFIGVEWHPDMPTFYDTKRIVDNSNAWSVRRPLYETSIGKWTKYRDMIHSK